MQTVSLVEISYRTLLTVSMDMDYGVTRNYFLEKKFVVESLSMLA